MCVCVAQVLFHVATAMPTSPKDPTCNEKRKYIGNDFVSIVYNDSGADFNIHTIKVYRYTTTWVCARMYAQQMCRVTLT